MKIALFSEKWIITRDAEDKNKLAESTYKTMCDWSQTPSNLIVLTFFLALIISKKIKTNKKSPSCGKSAKFNNLMEAIFWIIDLGQKLAMETFNFCWIQLSIKYSFLAEAELFSEYWIIIKDLLGKRKTPRK